jgi:protein-S-isoprenylcysteine O-methyltransferase Ste14
VSEVVLRVVVPVLWLAWLLYWWISARNVKPTRWRESVASQLRHRVPLLIAAFLWGVPQWLPKELRRSFVPAGAAFPIVGAVLVAVGLGFSVWARRHLGRNWSASVVVKEGHALIRTGPYRHLRHPIYTGILLAFLGTAVTIGEWRALLGLLLVVVSFATKSRQEEKRMRETFPEYEQYQRKTAALIPFVY